MSGTDLRACQDFSQQLQSWGITNLTSGDLWEDEMKMLLADVDKQRQQYEKQNEGATHRLVTFFHLGDQTFRNFLSRVGYVLIMELCNTFSIS
jgi:hypothetical protein